MVCAEVAPPSGSVLAFSGVRGGPVLGLSLVETLRKLKKLPRKNSSREAVLRVKEADLAPPSPTLLLTKQALRGTLARLRAASLKWCRMPVGARIIPRFFLRVFGAACRGRLFVSLAIVNVLVDAGESV